MAAARPAFLVSLRRGGFMIAASLDEARAIPGAAYVRPCRAIRGDQNIPGEWFVVDEHVGAVIVDQAQIDAIKARRAEAKALLTPEQQAACGLDET